KAEHRGKIKCAIVMEVVTDEPISNWCLRRNCLYGGVSVDHSRRRVEARIGDSPNANFTVVPWYVLHQPIDRVVGIRGFVDILRALLVRYVRTHVDEIAFRHHSSPNVLIYEYVERSRE